MKRKKTKQQNKSHTQSRDDYCLLGTTWHVMFRYSHNRFNSQMNTTLETGSTAMCTWENEPQTAEQNTGVRMKNVHAHSPTMLACVLCIQFSCTPRIALNSAQKGLIL